MFTDAFETHERSTEAARRKFGINPPLVDPPTRIVVARHPNRVLRFRLLALNNTRRTDVRPALLKWGVFYYQ